jgi:hypothetical protein
MHIETTPATTQDEQVADTIHAALAAKGLNLNSPTVSLTVVLPTRRKY